MSEFGVTDLTGFSGYPLIYDDYIFSRNSSNRHTAPENGYITSIKLYCDLFCSGEDVPNPTAMKYAIYDSSNNLLGQTEEITISDGYSWQSANLETPVNITKGSQYVFAVWWETGSINLYLKNITDITGYKSLEYTGDYPTTLTWTSEGYDWDFPIKCTYYKYALKTDTYAAGFNILPERIDYTVTKNVTTYGFADNTYAIEDMGKATEQITLNGCQVDKSGWTESTTIHNMMDSQEDVTIYGLPDTDLNTDYLITNFNVNKKTGEPYNYYYSLTLERLRDRI